LGFGFGEIGFGDFVLGIWFLGFRVWFRF